MLVSDYDGSSYNYYSDEREDARRRRRRALERNIPLKNRIMATFLRIIPMALLSLTLFAIAAMMTVNKHKLGSRAVAINTPKTTRTGLRQMIYSTGLDRRHLGQRRRKGASFDTTMTKTMPWLRQQQPTSLLLVRADNGGGRGGETKTSIDQKTETMMSEEDLLKELEKSNFKRQKVKKKKRKQQATVDTSSANGKKTRRVLKKVVVEVVLGGYSSNGSGAAD